MLVCGLILLAFVSASFNSVFVLFLHLKDAAFLYGLGIVYFNFSAYPW